jgi:hypothetical protein
LQEIILAPFAVAYCGKNRISWTAFSSGFRQLRIYDWKYRAFVGKGCQVFDFRMMPSRLHAVYKLSYFPGAFEEDRDSFRLSQLCLRSARDMQATDPRDHIFALLGMCSINQRVTSFQADYTKSFSEVIVMATRAMIEEDGSLDLFAHLDPFPESSEIPSWTVDLRRRRQLVSFLWHPHTDGKLAKYLANIDEFLNAFNLGFAPSTIVLDLGDPTKLGLQGGCVDEIVEIICFENLYNSTRFEILDSFNELRSGSPTPRVYLPSREPFALAFLRTVTADRLPLSHKIVWKSFQEAFPAHEEYVRSRQGEHYSANWHMDHPADFDFTRGLAVLTPKRIWEIVDMKLLTDLYTKLWLPWLGEKLPTSPGKMQQIYSEITSSINLHMRHRSFFRTKKGYMGIASKVCQTGDQVYSILGGQMPYILRRTETEGEFRILGEAYIHGIMNGEFWFFGDSKNVQFGPVVLV